MGTDIHGIWQARKDGRWIDVASEWEQDRHYFLFAWLADVRNGYGFAGIPTHDPIVPIAQPRGLPPDFDCVDDMHRTSREALDPRRSKWMDAEDIERGYFMGDHSHSWLTADEILDAPRPFQTRRTGVISKAEFDAWDGHSAPESYCGDISGRDVVVSEPGAISPKTTHVRISWRDGEDALAYFVDEVKRLRDLHGEVRLVFGFDS